MISHSVLGIVPISYRTQRKETFPAGNCK